MGRPESVQYRADFPETLDLFAGNQLYTPSSVMRDSSRLQYFLTATSQDPGKRHSVREGQHICV